MFQHIFRSTTLLLRGDMYVHLLAGSSCLLAKIVAKSLSITKSPSIYRNHRNPKSTELVQRILTNLFKAKARSHVPTNLSDTLLEVDISDHMCAANYIDPIHGCTYGPLVNDNRPRISQGTELSNNSSALQILQLQASYFALKKNLQLQAETQAFVSVQLSRSLFNTLSRSDACCLGGSPYEIYSQFKFLDVKLASSVHSVCARHGFI